MDSKIKFLAIGDVVNDDFIELDTGVTVKEDDNGQQQLEIRFGDKIPYTDHVLVKAVGNSPNAAMSATRLGLSAAIMTHVGDDDLGGETIETMQERGIDTAFVTQEAGKNTNYHFVLRYHAERTILVNHEAYTYDLRKQVEGKPVPEWVYFSSVGEDSMEYHKDIADWVKENDIKLAFQPGTFQIKLGYEPLSFIYEACELFFCNVEEAIAILKPVRGEVVDEKRQSAKERKDLVLYLLEEMSKLGPRIVCITDGPDGAYAYSKGEAWYMPIYPDPKAPVDRTGAGDSFSSTFTSALALGNDIPTAITWGPVNSMNVVQYIGAQEGLLTKDKLMEFLESAPEHYVPEKIM